MLNTYALRKVITSVAFYFKWVSNRKIYAGSRQKHCFGGVFPLDGN